MLEIDVKRIEAGRLGDPRDLDPADEADGHRDDEFVPIELLPHIVAQDRTQIPAHLHSPALYRVE